MLRLFFLSLMLAVVQCSLCESETWLTCRCTNDEGRQLLRMSHNKLDTGDWDTQIVNYGSCCDVNSAQKLWDNITGNNNCIHTPSKPEIGTRPSESQMIDRGYERHGTSFYKFHTVTQDWESARRVCMSEGAHLAIVNTKEEAQMLMNIFKRYPKVQNTYNNYYALIGFHDQFSEGNYLTIFGEPIEVAGYAEWEAGAPENLGRDYAGHPGENCGGINREGKLDDMPCSVRYAFFCELEDSDYPFSSEINYSAGYYTGVESVKKQPPGKKKRMAPSSGYTYYPGIGFYKMHTRTEIWENARRICESEDAHLAIINSERESAVLTVIFSKHKKIYDATWNECAFIGFHDQYKEGQFLTIFNETLESTGFTRWWDSDVPDNVGANNVDVGQDCGSVHRNGGLNDLQCHKRHAFICEQPLYM